MGRLDDEQIEGKLLLFAGDLLTVLLLTVGSAIAFAAGYDLKLDLGAVLMFCVFAGTAATVLHRLSQPWGALGTMAGIGLIFWIAWEKIAPPLAWIAQKMNLLPIALGGPPFPRAPDSRELLPVMLLLCAALAWLMGWIAVRARRWYLAALLSLAIVMPAIQGGVLPAWGAMLAVFAGWGSMLLTSLYGRKDPGSLGRAELLSLGGMAALIAVLVAALPMKGYTRPQWATDTRTNLITGVSRQLEKFMDLDELNHGFLADLGIDLSLAGQGGTSGSAGGGGSGVGGTGEREDLLRAGPRRYTDQRILTLRTDQKGGGRIYLRGNSLGVYTGTSWEMVEGDGYPFFPSEYMDHPDAQPSLYPAAASDGYSYTMSIRDILHRGVNYYPYFPMLETGQYSESGWLTLSEDGGEAVRREALANQLEYQVKYVPGGPERSFRPLMGHYAAEEEAYRREVVDAYYLDVPDEAQIQLMGLLNSEGLQEGWDMAIEVAKIQLEAAEGAERERLEESLENMRALRERAGAYPDLYDFGGPVELWDGMDTLDRFHNIVTAASRTAQLLDAAAAYDPDTPAMPGDYSDFMAYFLSEGRGYCIHFATAGALLLRMQGIPARYVTGYAVWLDASGQGAALDSDAHAWVEVYIDGYGWYPVEMTPGYAGGEDGVSLAGAAEETEPDEEDVPEEDAPEEESDLPEDEPEETPEENALPGEEIPEDAPGFVFPWKAVLGAVLTLGALAGAYALSFLPRKLERESEDINRSVISAYKRYSRGLRWGCEGNDLMEELGRKAKFSQHTLTAEERETAWRCLDESAGRVRARLPKWRKFLFPLMKPML